MVPKTAQTLASVLMMAMVGRGVGAARVGCCMADRDVAGAEAALLGCPGMQVLTGGFFVTQLPGW
jgi:hypothetical protein